MKLETKFNCGDMVWKINHTRVMVELACKFCCGSGKINGKDGSETSCPKCYGKRVDKTWEDQGWHISQETPTLTIGEIRCKFTAEYKNSSSPFLNYGPQKEHYEEEYMCYETGIGSGTLHKVDSLFKTKAEAINACEMKNNSIML
jgi:hypothetical protein